MKSVRIKVFDTITKKTSKLDCYHDNNRGLIVLRSRNDIEWYTKYGFKILSDHIERKVEPITRMRIT